MHFGFFLLETIPYMARRVTFSAESLCTVHKDDLNLKQRLLEYRTCDYNRRQADAFRYQQLLAPILTPEHRLKIKLLLESMSLKV